ncbi:MAG: hypothetical protein NC123_12650 [Butyrivibrio sp.]|nr:hypothetical protein [Acetatifactor muris]MCM1560371.1 hypothetical protein [Butyrivibrio sp.]
MRTTKYRKKIVGTALAAGLIVSCLTGCGSQEVKSRETAKTDDSVSVSAQSEAEFDSGQIIVANKVVDDVIVEETKEAVAEEETGTARTAAASVASDAEKTVDVENTEGTTAEETTEAAESTRTVQNNQSTQSTQNAQTMQNSQSTQSTQNAQTIQNTQDAQSTRQTQQAAQNTQQSQTVKAADAADETIVSTGKTVEAAGASDDTTAQAGETTGIDNIQTGVETAEVTVTVYIPPAATKDPVVVEKPAVTEPAVTEPAVTEPAAPEPVVEEPAAPKPLGVRICWCGHKMEIYTYGLSADEKAAWKAHAAQHLANGENTNYHDKAY